MLTKREIDLKYDQEVLGGPVDDLIFLLKHIFECEKCRMMWEEIELCAGV